MNAQYMRKDKQGIIGIEGALRDFTKSKENQEKTKQADKLELLGIMAGGIAHNFNNILTAILGHASIARLELKEDSPLMHHLDTIETSSLQAGEICKQMLAYTGQGKYTVEPLNLSQAIENINIMVQASFSDQTDIEYKLQPDLPSIQADSSQIQQLVIDLILNAVEAYQNQQGYVLVQTGCKAMQKGDFKDCLDSGNTKAGEYVFLRVIDEGCGISRDMQQRIFEPFVTTKFTGRGLSLSAVCGIVRSHHGVIRLQSTEGKGTTITVFFPVDSTPA
jgi:signal transduction histidine kinase